MASNGLFGWNLFGNIGSSPAPDPYNPQYQSNPNAYYKAYERWASKEAEKKKRLAMYQEMSRTMGPTAPAFTTSMGTRDWEPFAAAGSAPVDILAPEVESYADWERKQPNMFRTV